MTFLAFRRAAAAFYDNAFRNHPNIITPYRAPYCNHAFHQYTLVLDGIENAVVIRNGLNEFLSKNNIPSMIYYPVPLYKQEAFAPYWQGGKLPITEQLCNEVISLPMHTELDKETLNYIVEAVINFFNQYEK